MSVITRAEHPAAMWPGVKGWFGLKYKQIDQQWSMLFDTIDSDKAYEEFVEATGFGLAPVKTEGASIAYDKPAQGYTQRLYNVMYALGYMVTLEEIQDNKYKTVSERRAGLLAWSLAQTAEIVHANIFNRAFDSTNYPIGDGAAWLSTAHPTRFGNQSNKLAVDADISEAAIEDLSVQVRSARNNRGLKIALKRERLVVPPQSEFIADRLVNSTLRSGTANNDKNTLNGLFPQGVMVYDYLTDNDAWFIQTNVDQGLVHAERMAPSLEKDDDFDTANAKARTMTRFLCGVTDWRGMYGSQGA